MSRKHPKSLARPLAIGLLAALAALGSTGCTGTSTNQELRQDYVALKGALESYARANGAFPEALAQLTQPDRRGKRHLDDPSRLTDPYGHPYTYSPPQGAQPPVIRSLGTDGSNPADDIDLRELLQSGR